MIQVCFPLVLAPLLFENCFSNPFLPSSQDGKRPKKAKFLIRESGRAQGPLATLVGTYPPPTQSLLQSIKHTSLKTLQGHMEAVNLWIKFALPSLRINESLVQPADNISCQAWLQAASGSNG